MKKKGLIYEIDQKRVIAEAFIVLFGVFILGVLFCSIWTNIDPDKSSEIRIIDQCNKFGSFYSSDEKVRYWCIKSQE